MEESLSCQTCCDTGPRFFRSHTKDRPIWTVASYYTQGDVENLVQQHVNFSKHFPTLSKRHMHIFSVTITTINAKFGECQSKGVRGVDCTKQVPYMKTPVCLPCIHRCTLCNPVRNERTIFNQYHIYLWKYIPKSDRCSLKYDTGNIRNDSWYLYFFKQCVSLFHWFQENV
jgi:hypothetical protein